MNSVHLFVQDAVGAHFLDTFTANTAENIVAFRKHARACRQYWRSAEYRAKVDPIRWPAFPVSVHVVPYHDASTNT